jgi:hypothetical protein
MVSRHLYQYGSPYVLTEAKTKIIFSNWSPIKSVFLVEIAVKIHCRPAHEIKPKTVAFNARGSNILSILKFSNTKV